MLEDLSELPHGSNTSMQGQQGWSSLSVVISTDIGRDVSVHLHRDISTQRQKHRDKDIVTQTKTQRQRHRDIDNETYTQRHICSSTERHIYIETYLFIYLPTQRGICIETDLHRDISVSMSHLHRYYTQRHIHRDISVHLPTYIERNLGNQFLLNTTSPICLCSLIH